MINWKLRFKNKTTLMALIVAVVGGVYGVLSALGITPVIAQVWGMLIWFIPAALLTGLLKSPWAKGHITNFLFAHWQPLAAH